VSAALSVRGLRAGYGGLAVVHGVDLDVRAGGVTVVVGSNGAGKTTLLKALSGLLAYTGEARLDGTPLPARPAAIVARGLGHVPEGRQLFPHMTVRETLELGGWRLPARERAARLEEVGALFPKLVERRHQLAGSMSGGEQQLLAIARALMGRPRLLMLDEPSLGLAPRMVDQVLAVVGRFHAEGGTVLLVEQAVVKALALADDAYVLERGRVVLHGPAREVRDSPVLRSAYLGGAGGP
jgi:ABC-type branched-subunit amino acid transport system ATPase component